MLKPKKARKEREQRYCEDKRRSNFLGYCRAIRSSIVCWTYLFRASAMRGIILTNNQGDFLAFRKAVRKYSYDTVKVVTEWGTGKAWDTITRAQILALTPYTIVRTVTGDPSYRNSWNGKRDYVYPDTKRAIAEIAPWYAIKPDILIEIGNEPNINNSVNPWNYRYYLQDTLTELRKVFPLAKFISTGLIQNSYELEWYQVLGKEQTPVLPQFDYIGVHLYEDTQLFINELDVTPKTQKTINLARQFGPLFITEMGINKASNDRRLRDYTALTALYPGVVYHYNSALDIDPQYHWS
jgi:hypothetical protein